MSTGPTDVKSDQWYDLGTTPCFLQLKRGNQISFIIDTVLPTTTDLSGCHDLGGIDDDGKERERSSDIGLTGQHVYARVEAGTSRVIVSR